MGANPQSRVPEPEEGGRRGLARTLVELSGRVTKGMGDMWKGLVSGLWRQVFRRWETDSAKPNDDDPDAWLERIETALNEAFGDRIPKDFKAKSLMTWVESSRDARLMTELLGVLGTRGCPCNKTLISSLRVQVRRVDEVPVLARLLDSLETLDDKDKWSTVIETIEREATRSGGWPALAALAAEIQPICGALEVGILEELSVATGSEDSRESLLAVVRNLGPKIADRELLVAMARRATSSEAAGAAIELAGLLDERGVSPIPVKAFDTILEGVRDRIAIRRYRKALELMESAGIAIDPLDPFLRTEVVADPRLEWLEQAIANLPDLSTRVDVKALDELREVAPDVAALGRYTRAMTAYATSGLNRSEIRELLRDYVGSDETMRTFHRVGQVLGELFEGNLTFDYAKWALSKVSEPLSVKRLRRLLELLIEAGVRDPKAQQRLIAIFPLEDEGVAWLEGVLSHLTGVEPSVYPTLIPEIRKRCPDVASATRYFRLHRQLSKVPGVDPINAVELALEASGSSNDSQLMTDIRAVISGDLPVSSLVLSRK